VHRGGVGSRIESCQPSGSSPLRDQAPELLRAILAALLAG